VIRLFVVLTLLAPLGLVLVGCGPSYSPNTYASNAAQQANKVESGVIAGIRKVRITTSGTVGGVAGAAAGGVAGAQVGVGPTSAFSAIGGSLVGGIAGVATEHIAGDTNGFEYIVRKANGDMISVVQKDEKALRVGEKVLVIAGPQARIVPDYTVPFDAPDKAASQSAAPAATNTASHPSSGSTPSAGGCAASCRCSASASWRICFANCRAAADHYATGSAGRAVGVSLAYRARDEALIRRDLPATADLSVQPCYLPGPARRSMALGPRRHSEKRPDRLRCRDV
jgi:outer membrane lipoprotein SlyB